MFKDVLKHSKIKANRVFLFEKDIGNMMLKNNVDCRYIT